MYKSFNTVCYGIGCLCRKDMSYLLGRPTRWSHSFATINYDYKNTFVNIHEIKDNSTVVNGILYKI